MLTRDLPASQTSLVVEPQPHEAILAEEGDHPLAFVVPPTADLKAIEELRSKNTSLEDVAAESVRSRAAAFEAALEANLEKFDRFSGSPTYLNRLANLAAVALDVERESGFLALARKVSSDPFFTHRHADSLLGQGRWQEAERLFGSLDLDRDVYGNLKLAVFHVRRSDLAAASTRVAKALEIDPLDFGALLFNGGLHLLAGRYDEAIRSLRIASEERPTSSAVYTNMAVAYARLGFKDKALVTLKKAVALAPLNATAVFLLADFAFEYGHDEDAIPGLRYLLEFEQKLPEGWARLARASLQLGDTDTAITALRRQASLHESSGVWNNLGVAYAIRKDRERALQAFKRAIDLGTDSRGRDYFLAARNIAQVFAESGANEDLLRFTTAVLESDGKQLTRRDDALSDLYALHMHGLRCTGNVRAMRAMASNILEAGNFPNRLVAWTLSSVIAYDALYERDRALLLTQFENWKQWIDATSILDVDRRTMLYNNVAFALAEAGQIDEAEKYLGRISSRLHKDPYPTATLGLVSFRRGHVERAVLRYREAISLAKSRQDKTRIRQKLNLELARHYMESSPTKARRLLATIIATGGGEPALIEQARSQLALLPR